MAHSDVGDGGVWVGAGTIAGVCWVCIGLFVGVVIVHSWFCCWGLCRELGSTLSGGEPLGRDAFHIDVEFVL